MLGNRITRANKMIRKELSKKGNIVMEKGMRQKIRGKNDSLRFHGSVWRAIKHL